MKKLLLLFAMILCFSTMMFAQVSVHVSGTVLRDSTNIPVVGHEVIITADSNVAGFYFWAQRFTSATGHYDCTIANAPGGVGITFLVKTKNCDSTYMVQSFQTSNSPAVENFLLCNAPENCQSYFTYNKNFLNVSFESHTNSADSISYSWNFGDIHSWSANFSTERNPHHVFSYDDYFNVTLTTTTTGGCTWTSAQTVFVSYTCDVNGAVVMGNTFVDHGMIELIRVDSGNVMTVVDSHEFGDSLGMYWFGGVSPGHYYLLAQLLPASSRYGDFVPTYFEEAINWTNAHLIELGQPNNPYNFHLIESGPHSPGNGMINGTITRGTKVNGGGTPEQDVEVLLLDASNKPLEVTNTDASGHFGFNNIAMGSYIVYPEAPGLTTSPANVTLHDTHSIASTPFSMNGQQIAYGINDQLPRYISGIGDIYPNPPTKGIASMNVSVTRELDLSLSLYNQTGQVIREFQTVMHKGENVIYINTSGLAKSPYYLKISIPDGGSVIRKLFIVQ